MQIFCPSAFQLMLLTTDLFRLLIISSYHAPSRRPQTEEGRRSWQPEPSKGNVHILAFSVQPSPLYSIHTIMSPFWSLVVSFWYCSFQVTTCTAPASVWVRRWVISPELASHPYQVLLCVLQMLQTVLWTGLTYRCDPLESGSWTGYWERQDLWLWHHLQTAKQK